jgi:drug/metabolite transporter (DMT)-like permease
MDDSMRKGVALALIAAVVSGVSVFINGIAIKLADPLAYTLIKNLGAFVFLAAIIFAFSEYRHFRSLSKRQWGMLALIGIVGGSVPFVMFFWGLKLGGAAVSSFIFRSLFIFAAITGYFILKEKPEPRDVAAGFIILIGNALLVSGDVALGPGPLLVLGATALWSVEYALSRKVMSDVHPRAVMASRMFFGSLVLMSFLFSTGSLGTLSDISAQAFEWLALTSLLLGAFLMSWYACLRHLPLLKAASIFALGGLVTVALEAAFLGKAVTPAEGAGLLFILLGVALVAAGISEAMRSAAPSAGVQLRA